MDHHEIVGFKAGLALWQINYASQTILYHSCADQQPEGYGSSRIFLSLKISYLLAKIGVQ